MAGLELGKHTELPELSELMKMSEEELGRLDLAKMNLAVVKMALGSNYSDYLKTLDEWTDHLRKEMERNLYLYQRDPASFDNSEAYFRVLMMNTIIKEDFKVGYDPELMESPEDRNNSGYAFFSDPAKVFLPGMLGPKDRLGTCTSLPVLFAALGRRLGYPIKLVLSKGHVFCRWDDGEEVFNIEMTNKGVSRKSDDYYRKWPFPITPEEEEKYSYLKSLSSKEELALFLGTLGNVRMAHGQYSPAAITYDMANQLAPRLGKIHMAMINADLADSRQPNFNSNIQNRELIIMPPKN